MHCGKFTKSCLGVFSSWYRFWFKRIGSFIGFGITRRKVYKRDLYAQKIGVIGNLISGNFAIWRKNKEIYKNLWNISSKLKGNLPLLMGNFD